MVAEQPDEQIAQVRAARLRAGRLLNSLPNVIGTGVGFNIKKGERTGQVGITAFVRKKVSREHLTDAEVVPGEVELEASETHDL